MEFFNKTLYPMSWKREHVELIMYCAISFFIPFAIGHPQIVVGILVNLAIILSSTNMRNHKLLPVIMLPSIAVLLRGVIFGPFTIFLIYIIPFIWIGNSILSLGIKYFYVNKKWNYFIVMLITSAVKAMFLFGSAYLLFSLKIIPMALLAAMGLMQFITAVSAGFIAYGVLALMKRNASYANFSQQMNN